MPLSGELCSLEESGRSLEKEDRIELNDWIASLHKKHRQEEVSSRLGVKVCFILRIRCPQSLTTTMNQPSIPTEAEMEAEVKEKATSESISRRPTISLIVRAQLGTSLPPGRIPSTSLAQSPPSSPP